MKTYILERDYGRDLRVTVEDDTLVNSYGVGPFVVTFSKHVGEYHTETLASFANVVSVRLEGLSVEEKEYEYAEAKAQAELSKPTVTWKSI